MYKRFFALILIFVTMFGLCSNLWAESKSGPGCHRDVIHVPQHVLKDECKTPPTPMSSQLSHVVEITRTLMGDGKLSTKKYLKRGDFLSDFQTAPNNTKFLTGFYKLFEEMKERDLENPCKAAEDKTWVRERALILMNKALASFCISSPTVLQKDDAKDKNKFNRAMENMWRSLLSLLAEHEVAAPHGSRRKRVEETVEHVKESLKNGMILLPYLHEETSQKQDLFSYSSLSQYLFYGIAPIDLRMTPYEKLVQQPQHPLRHSFLRSVYDFVEHDIQHSAVVMSKIYQEHQIENKERCSQFFNCLKTIPNVNDKQKSKDLRLALYYLLHEDRTPLANRSSHSFSFLNFAEFSMERLLVDEKVFNIETLLGTGEGRTKFCAAASSIYLSEEKHFNVLASHFVTEDDIEKIKTATPFLSSIFPAHFGNEFQIQISKIINKGESDDDLIVNYDGTGIGILDTMYNGYLFGSLMLTCFPEANKLSKTTVMPLNEAKSYLSSKFKIWEENGFHEKFMKSCKNVATKIEEVIGHFEKDQNCKDILRRGK